MKKVIIFIFIILIILLVILSYFLITLSKKEKIEQEASIVTNSQTIEDFINKYDSKYIKKEQNTIYLEFGKDLFEENGNDNKNYFYDLSKDLEQFFPSQTFYLIDESKNIKITVQYVLSDNKYVIKINDKENFFDVINGKDYVDVDKMSITKNSNINISNPYLDELMMNTMYFSSIEEDIGEGEPLDNGYTSYLNGTVKIRLAPTKAVRNIIFTKDYPDQIVSNITKDMSLRQIYDLNNTNTFGSLEDKYLGYKESDYYIFFYSDETSIYSYSYAYNEDMEDIIEEYLQTKDLDKFVNRITKRCKTYDYYEYDPEKQNAYILYSNRGLEIDIKNNDPKGIKLYTNYYLTDKTKQFVKDGLISIDSKNDLIDVVEKERRNQK